MSTKKKTRNKNYYKDGKVRGLLWKANVTNDESKTVATLSFSKDFNQAARDLKAVSAKLNKEVRNVKRQVKKLRDDEKTGELLRNALDRQYSSIAATQKDFADSVKNLYNGAIDEFNSWLQSMYETYAQNKNTNQGSAETVVKESIEQAVNPNE